MKKNKYINLILLFICTICALYLFESNIYADDSLQKIITDDGKTDSVICKYFDNDDNEFKYKSINIKDIDKISFKNNNISIQINNDNQYEYIQPDYKRKIHNITKLKNEWSTNKTALNVLSNYLKDNQDEVIVAVVDTGVEITHELLKDRLISGYDFIDHDDIANDKNGHGTHVAGIVAANTPENIKIMPIRAMDKYGYGYDSVLALGVYYAVKQGADVINLSFGGIGYSKYLDEALNYALDNNVLVVASAGNDSEDVSKFFPASKEEIIVVSSINELNDISLFSNYGNSIDICAPGSSIYSSSLDNQYSYMSGTSFASPFISSALALIKLEDKNRSPKEIEKILKMYTDDLGNEGYDNVFGYGSINFTNYVTVDKSFKIISPTSDIDINGKINIKYFSNGHIGDIIKFYFDNKLIDQKVIDSEGYNNYILQFEDKEFKAYNFRIELVHNNKVIYENKLKVKLLEYNTSFYMYDVNYKKFDDFEIQIYGIKDKNSKLVQRVNSNENGIAYTNLDEDIFRLYDRIVIITGGKQISENIDIPIYIKTIVSCGNKLLIPNNIQTVYLDEKMKNIRETTINPFVNNYTIQPNNPIVKKIESEKPVYIECGSHVIKLHGWHSGSFEQYLYRLKGHGINYIDDLHKDSVKLTYNINNLDDYICFSGSFVTNSKIAGCGIDTGCSFDGNLYFINYVNPGIYEFSIKRRIGGKDSTKYLRFSNTKKLKSNQEHNINVGKKLENSFLINYYNDIPQVIAIVNDEYDSILYNQYYDSMKLGLEYFYNVVLVDEKGVIHYSDCDFFNDNYYGYKEMIYNWSNIPDGNYTLKMIYSNLLKNLYDIKANEIKVTIKNGKFDLNKQNESPIVRTDINTCYKVKPFKTLKLDLKKVFNDKENDKLYYTINKGYIYNNIYYYRTAENELTDIKITANDLKGGSCTANLKVITEDTIQMNQDMEIDFTDWAEKQLDNEFSMKNNFIFRFLNDFKEVINN